MFAANGHIEEEINRVQPRVQYRQPPLLFRNAGRGLFEGDLVMAIAILAVFLVRTFYFAFFELSWQGQTPGKRRLGIRAVDARGGPLTAEAIIARTLTRELELFLPVAALFAPQLLFPGAPAWAGLAAAVWMLVFGALPLFNRDRLRVGDLVAGTVVVRTPGVVLLEDLAVARAREAREEPAFTEAQLDVYGVYELQVLEGVLRSGGAGHHEAVRTVAEKIREKIGWTGSVRDDEVFLQAFYAALRGPNSRLIFMAPSRMEIVASWSSGIRWPSGVSTRMCLMLSICRWSSFRRTATANFFSPSQISVACLPPRAISITS